MPFTIVRQDITKMKVDAIVNAANTDLAMGGGVCGAIFKAAGARELQEACDKAAPIRTGEAALTPAFALGCRYIIHAAGPVYRQHDPLSSAKLLKNAYLASLKLAEENGCESIAFPLISSGIFGYPKEEALRVATEAISDYLENHEMNVYLTVFDRASFCVSEKLTGAVASYIDENYVKTHNVRRRNLLEAETKAFCDAEYLAPQAVLGNSSATDGDIENVLDNLDEPFQTALFRLIDARGMTDVEVYKRANLDRKLFSKMRSVKGYMPSKRTVLALAVALELGLDETDELLKRAGYALSRSQRFDVIIEFFIIHSRFNIYEINEILFKYDQPLLGG